MMRRAAGTAAVQSLKTGLLAAEFDMRALVGTLRENGANLPQPEVRRETTRA